MNSPDNAEGLDEILDEFHGKGHPDYPADHNGALDQAKQAILHWIDKEVIGEDETPDNLKHIPYRDIPIGDIEKVKRDIHRAEQRTILTQHGYKGGKR